MASRKDYYDILGVRRGATEEEIEKAYRKLARTYQGVPPQGNRNAEFRFREILEAYEILSDKTRRENYDLGVVLTEDEDFEWEEDDEEASVFEGFEDLFDGVATKAASSQRGKDVHCALEIDFETSIRGGEREIRITEEVPCKTCGGTGVNGTSPQKICFRCGGAGHVQIGIPPSAFSQECSRCLGSGRVRVQVCKACSGKRRITEERSISVDIPAGVTDGCVLYLSRMGHAGRSGGARGDLIATISVRKHPYFRRQGDDIYMDLPLAVWEAALGTRVDVPTLQGPMTVEIPPGTQPGQEFRLAGRGLPFLEGGGRGEQVLVARVLIPRGMDGRARRIFEEMKESRSFAHPRRGPAWRGKKHLKEGDR